MSEEDELVNSLISYYSAPTAHVVPEARYNYYGDRGVVDLYVEVGDCISKLYEVKSERAVRDATGANEILRQFNKMHDFFYKGSDYEKPGGSIEHTGYDNRVEFLLVFVVSEYNIRHLAKNAPMYYNADGIKEDGGGRVRRYDRKVMLMTKDATSLPHPVEGDTSINITDKGYAGLVRQQTPEVYEEFGGVFKEVAEKYDAVP